MKRPHLMQRATLVLSLIAIAAFGVFPQTALRAQSVFARWSTSPVLVYVNPQNAMVSMGTAESAVLSAMDAWSQVPGSAFEYMYGGRVNDISTTFDNRNVVIFRTQAQGSASASTYTWLSGATVVDSDTVIWVPADNGGHGAACLAATSLENIAKRELGYALGLDEALLAGDAPNGCAIGRRGLGASEAAALIALYPDTTSERPPFGVTLLPAFAGDVTVASDESTTVVDSHESSASTPAQTQTTVVANASGSSTSTSTPASTTSRGSSAETPTDASSSTTVSNSDNKADGATSRASGTSTSRGSNARTGRDAAVANAGADAPAVPARVRDDARVADNRVAAPLKRTTSPSNSNADASEPARTGQTASATGARTSSDVPRPVSDVTPLKATMLEAATLGMTSAFEPTVNPVASSPTRFATDAAIKDTTSRSSTPRPVMKGEPATPAAATSNPTSAPRAFSQAHATSAQNAPAVVVRSSSSQTPRASAPRAAQVSAGSTAAPPHRIASRRTNGRLNAATRRARAASMQQRTARKVRRATTSRHRSRRRQPTPIASVRRRSAHAH